MFYDICVAKPVWMVNPPFCEKYVLLNEINWTKVQKPWVLCLRDTCKMPTANRVEKKQLLPVGKYNREIIQIMISFVCSCVF